MRRLTPLALLLTLTACSSDEAVTPPPTPTPTPYRLVEDWTANPDDAPDGFFPDRVAADVVGTGPQTVPLDLPDDATTVTVMLTCAAPEAEYRVDIDSSTQGHGWMTSGPCSTETMSYSYTTPEFTDLRPDELVVDVPDDVEFNVVTYSEAPVVQLP
jgi:hypothetical protein